MMKISQREARRLRQKVRQLEDQEHQRNRVWVEGWPNGVHLGSLAVPEWIYYSALTARKLGHAIVVTTADAGKFQFIAMRLK
jgi:hypothetical protein